MARKRKHAEHVNHERWLVSYADFITLLFAFFVVMFAASNADQKKAGQLAQAVQGAFHDLAFFAPAGKVVPLFDEGGVPSSVTAVLGNQQSAFDSTQVVPSAGKGSGFATDLNAVKTKFEEILKDELESGAVRLVRDERGLTVSLAEAGFFAPGSAVMESKGLAPLERISTEIRESFYHVRVEGHTDNTPIRTAQFPSNWELSTARATHMLQYLINTAQIAPERLSAVGYGEYRPIADNASLEGRATNRRVDLVILGEDALKMEP